MSEKRVRLATAVTLERKLAQLATIRVRSLDTGPAKTCADLWRPFQQTPTRLAALTIASGAKNKEHSKANLKDIQ